MGKWGYPHSQPFAVLVTPATLGTVTCFPLIVFLELGLCTVPRPGDKLLRPVILVTLQDTDFKITDAVIIKATL